MAGLLFGIAPVCFYLKWEGNENNGDEPMTNEQTPIGPGTIEALSKPTAKEAYLRKLDRDLARSLYPTRAMQAKKIAAQKGFAVHRQVMCGETQSSFFLLHLDDPIAAACGYSLHRADRVAACITGVSQALEMVKARDPVAWAKANGGWLWIQEGGAQ